MHAFYSLLIRPYLLVLSDATLGLHHLIPIDTVIRDPILDGSPVKDRLRFASPRASSRTVATIAL